METQNFQNVFEQAAVVAVVLGFDTKPREFMVQKPSMTAHEFAEIWDLPINKNGIIVGPRGYIFQQPEFLLEKLYRFLMGLPNTQPLLFRVGCSEPNSILDGGKEDSARYAIRMIGLEEGRNSVNQLQQVAWCFESELARKLNVLCTQQKCIVCGTYKRGDEFGTYGMNSDGNFRLKAYCKECDATQAGVIP